MAKSAVEGVAVTSAERTGISLASVPTLKVGKLIYYILRIIICLEFGLISNTVNQEILACRKN